MPLGDIATGLFEFVGRIIGQLFVDIILDILIRGPGYMIVRVLSGSKKDISDQDCIVITFAGVVFWIFIGFGIYLIFPNISE